MIRLRNLLRCTTVKLLDCRKSTTLNRWLSGWLIASLLLVETVSLSCFLISIGTTPVEGSLMRTLRCIPDHLQGRCLYRDTVILSGAALCQAELEEGESEKDRLPRGAELIRLEKSWAFEMQKPQRCQVDGLIKLKRAVRWVDGVH
jgi:hypothetical protein